jgi:tetratricopeptide (TPR) repeat protein
VKYCPECGHKLASGMEKFCPECGQKLAPSGGAINVDNISGDVFGTGFTGSGNIIGKEIAYTVIGNVLNLHISDNVSREVLVTLQRMIAVPSQVEQHYILNKMSTKEDIKTKLKESETAQQQIKIILNDVNTIGKNAGTQIQEIKAGDLEISNNELLLKEIVLKGNEHVYKNEYNEALGWYDKAIEINPYDANVWNNKGYALDGLGNYKEAIKCFDKAIEINPYDDVSWYNKGYALDGLGNYKEAIKCYDKAIEINPNRVDVRADKGTALGSGLGEYEEAIKCIDEALQIEPNNANVWNNKGYALGAGLGNYKEAIKCYDKTIEINPHDDLPRNNKAMLLNKQKRKKRWFR